MNAETTRVPRGGPFAALATIGLVALALWVTGSARAQESGPASPITASELESLVETLRDDAAREELLLTLEALVEAERARIADAPSSETGGVGGTVLDRRVHHAPGRRA